MSSFYERVWRKKYSAGFLVSAEIVSLVIGIVIGALL